ncbi:sugar ABC transporter substrate-binding protein [Butyrivibrio sp. MC2013]|uniref:sugar ABC transporter substrate-binding protein n=1 Tax=Butyrivibrio sp. MC2013 TaxID=1280686 RepID=UPI00041FD03A|nr:substrate-binding domain-containing protein [Butyrivibrio sp. MC2013]
MRDKMQTPENRGLIAIITLLIMGIILCAVLMGRAGIEKKPYRISVIVDDVTGTSRESLTAGLKQGALEKNVRLNYVTSYIQGDLEKLEDLMEQEIDNGAGALIVQLPSSNETRDMLFRISGKVPVELIETDGERSEEDMALIGCIEADSQSLGREMASSAASLYGGSLKGIRIGLLAGNVRTSALRDRQRAFEDEVKKLGGNLTWTLTGTDTLSERFEDKMATDKVDIIISQEEKLTLMAGRYKEDNGADYKLLGLGSSIDNLAYLDNRVTDMLFSVNNYQMGYMAVVDTAEVLENRYSGMKNRTISFSKVTADNIYSEDHQKLLFPFIK